MSPQSVYNPEALVEGSTAAIDDQEDVLSDRASNPSSEQNNDPSSIAAESPINQRLSLKESLGYGGLFGVIGGTLFILGLFGFLTFLWFGHGSEPEAADSTSLWRFIALNNYFSRTITICSVALRFAVSIQAAICTSMIAALILEKYGAQKHQVAWFSIIRSLNDGPVNLGRLLLSAKLRSNLLHVESWLTFLVIVVTLALQFSSTLLLSDINSFVIIGGLNKTKFGDVFGFNGEDQEVPFFASLEPIQFLLQHPVYAIFGEVQAGFDATPNNNGVSDTGLVQRSLLPILEADERRSVRKAEGTTMVMSSRSSCIRPRINAKYYTRHLSGHIYRSIEGTVDYDMSFESAGVTWGSLCNDIGCGVVAFDCVIPDSSITDSGWHTTACVLDNYLYRNATLPVINWDPEDGPWSMNATIALIITTNNTESQDWAGVANETTYRMGSQNFFNITLCSLAFRIDRFHTSMVAASPLREPQTQFSLVSSASHSTTDVQGFMGVKIPQGSHSDRKILDLEILGAPEDRPESLASMLVTAPWGTTTIIIFLQYVPSPGGVFLLLCYFCRLDRGYSVNNEIGLLFSDTVTETGRAANAFLSLMTTLFISVYYEYLGSLQEPRPCSTNVHLICVIIITALYVTQIQHSRHGNVWHTIAQLSGDDITDVLREAHDSSDAAVERALKSQHDNNQHLKIGRQEKTGRVEVIVD
ncbi:hypothetical protein F4680DRAFT_461551 [Xylaria scruposa]|nr:hypothetical protein F4680DRAFT_461551 [Xylaria scruposa]